MAFSATKIGRLAVKEQSGWGTKQSGFATANAIECEFPSFTLAGEAISMDALRMGFHSPRILEGSREGTTLSFTTYLHGYEGTLSSITGNPSDHPAALLMKSVLGGLTSSNYGTDLGGGNVSSSGSHYIEQADGTGAKVGAGVLVPTTTSGQYAAAFIKSVTDNSGSNDQLFTVQDLSGTPASSGTIYGSNTAYLSTGQPTPLTFEWLTGISAMAIRFFDAVVESVKISAVAKNVLSMEVSAKCGGWEVYDSPPGVPADFAYPYPVVPAAINRKGARLVANNTAMSIGQMEIECNAEYATMLSHNGAEGVGSYICTGRECKATVTYPTTTATSLVAGSQAGAMQFEITGGGPGQSFAMYMGSPILQEQQQIADVDGVIGLTHTTVAGQVTNETGTGDAKNSPFRVAFL